MARTCAADVDVAILGLGLSCMAPATVAAKKIVRDAWSIEALGGAGDAAIQGWSGASLL